MDGEAVAGNKKNARRRRAWILFQDESGVSERPPVRRTWAPKGETPVLVYAFNSTPASKDRLPGTPGWKKLSISAALGYRWDGKRCRLWFQTRPGSYNDERLIGFFARSEEALARAEGDSDLGWIACAQELEDEAVSGEPA